MLKKYIKRFVSGIVIGAMLASAGGACVFAAEDGAAEYTLQKTEHTKYMSGTNAAEFEPESYLTRAETAQIIYNLLTGKPSVSKRFDDVSDGEWYSEAVNSLYSAGIIHGKYSDSTYFPNDLISRAELVEMLSYFSESSDDHSSETKSFDDVAPDNPLYDHITAAASAGWISGYEDNTFRPDNPLTRAEAVCVFNRVLMRAPDTDYIASAENMRLFVDVHSDMWAYDNIMEAAVSHSYEKTDREIWTAFEKEPTGLSAGPHIFNHYLYYIDGDTGCFLRNCEINGYTLDKNGRYTTGNAELDSSLRAITSELCTNEAGSEENLKKVYDYVRDNFVYQARAHVARGSSGWELEYAVPMMRTHYGNCYSWAAVFMYLARNVGFEAYCQSGAVGARVEDHGWTEIMFDGEWLIFDPELENANHQRWSFYKLSYDNDFKKYYKYE